MDGRKEKRTKLSICVAPRQKIGDLQAMSSFVKSLTLRMFPSLRGHTSGALLKYVMYLKRLFIIFLNIIRLTEIQEVEQDKGSEKSKLGRDLEAHDLIFLIFTYGQNSKRVP